jgi:pyridoxamine 5'-phosphate oxidase
MDWTDTDLDNLPTRIWDSLSEAAGKPNHPFRTPAFATTNRFDTNVRTVVLRRVDPEYRWLVCYTDVRASKVRDIRKNQQVQWLFHHPTQQIQIRATSAAMVYCQDDIAREYWEKTPLANRVNYLASQMPGDALTDPGDSIPAEFKTDSVTEKDLEAGYQNFAVLACEVDQFDWLQLSPTGNRRASVRWTGAKYSSIWLVP